MIAFTDVAVIEHTCNELSVHLLLDRFVVLSFVEEFEVKLGTWLGAPQSQAITVLGVVARYWDIVGHRKDCFASVPDTAFVGGRVYFLPYCATKLDLVAYILTRYLPRLSFSRPEIGLFDLLSFRVEPLDKRAVIVADSVTPGCLLSACFLFKGGYSRNSEASHA